MIDATTWQWHMTWQMTTHCKIVHDRDRHRVACTMYSTVLQSVHGRDAVLVLVLDLASECVQVCVLCLVYTVLLQSVLVHGRDAAQPATTWSCAPPSRSLVPVLSYMCSLCTLDVPVLVLVGSYEYSYEHSQFCYRTIRMYYRHTSTGRILLTTLVDLE